MRANTSQQRRSDEALEPESKRPKLRRPHLKYVCNGHQRHWFAGEAKCRRCGAAAKQMSRKAIIEQALSILKEDRPGNYPEDDHLNRTNQMDEAIAILEQA